MNITVYPSRFLSCLRCSRDMVFLRREHLQLGKTGLFTGDWGNLLAGALDVAILQCPGCGKLEFSKGTPLRSKTRVRRVTWPR